MGPHLGSFHEVVPNNLRSSCQQVANIRMNQTYHGQRDSPQSRTGEADNHMSRTSYNSMSQPVCETAAECPLRPRHATLIRSAYTPWGSMQPEWNDTPTAMPTPTPPPVRDFRTPQAPCDSKPIVPIVAPRPLPTHSPQPVEDHQARVIERRLRNMSRVAQSHSTDENRSPTPALPERSPLRVKRLQDLHVRRPSPGPKSGSVPMSDPGPPPPPRFDSLPTHQSYIAAIDPHPATLPSDPPSRIPTAQSARITGDSPPLPRDGVVVPAAPLGPAKRSSPTTSNKERLRRLRNSWDYARNAQGASSTDSLQSDASAMNSTRLSMLRGASETDLPRTPEPSLGREASEGNSVGRGGGNSVETAAYLPED